MRNSPVRKRIIKGTVEQIRGRFERLNAQEIQGKTSPSKRGVLRQDSSSPKPPISGMKYPKKNSKKRTGSRKEVVLDRHQPTINDFFAGVVLRRDDPEASMIDDRPHSKPVEREKLSENLEKN